MSTSKKVKRNEEPLVFSKIHLPRMKSVFWKYFGFPSNENDEIITKQKVICTICNAILTNHYNTTNIRAHIQSTHKEIFAELISKHGIRIPPRKIMKKTRTRSMVDKCEDSISFDSKQTIKEEQLNYSVLHEDDTINLIEAIPLTYDDTDRLSSKDDNSEIFEVSTNNFLEQSKNRSVSPESEKNKNVATPLKITVDINPIQMPVECDVEESLRRIIVKDLLNVSVIYGGGIQEFVTGFLGDQVLPSLCKMESSIKKQHISLFSNLKDRIKAHSQTKAFSLCFDVWANIEGKLFVSIYFNFISEEYENQICDNLYMTVDLNNHTPFEQIFDNFRLENCSAAVINYNHEILNTFLSNNDIPIIYCFSYIINASVRDIFNLEEVADVFDKVQDVIARYTPEILSENIEIPTICKEYPLTKLTLLRFFCECVSWPDELDILISKAKHILDAVSPLEVTLDTMKEEEIPLSSLFVPFANKLIERHFSPNQYDEPILKQIKAVVTKEFKKSICSNNYLTATATLDPRFHKFLSIKNINSCLSILNKKFIQISTQKGLSLRREMVEKKDDKKNIKKSHLKLFFECPDTPGTTENVKTESYVEIDLRHYRDEAFASLEDSPLIWWSQMGHKHGSLKYLADAYNCILGFVNLNLKHSMKDQISFHRKRYMLTGKLIDSILFLNKIL